MRKRALIVCIFLAVICFIVGVYFLPEIKTEIKIEKMLASLTQEMIVKRVNPIRLSSGFSELKINGKLNRAAQSKAEDMIKRNYFSHTDPEGQPPWIWLEKVDYKYAAAGENLAMDVSDAKALASAWLASSSHAKNILNDYFKDVGIGIARGKISNKKTIVVVMFLASEISPQDFLTNPLNSSKTVPPETPLIIKK